MEGNKKEIMKERNAVEDNELSKEKQLVQIKKWFNWSLIITGIYFLVTGYYGALVPLREGGTDAINGIVIFTGIIALMGVVMIILGCRIFIKNNSD